MSEQKEFGPQFPTREDQARLAEAFKVALAEHAGDKEDLEVIAALDGWMANKQLMTTAEYAEPEDFAYGNIILNMSLVQLLLRNRLFDDAMESLVFAETLLVQEMDKYEVIALPERLLAIDQDIADWKIDIEAGKASRNDLNTLAPPSQSDTG